MNIKSFDGSNLFLKRDIPEGSKAIVIIVHGLCEHLGRYDYVTEKLNNYGYGVYRFDNRGHGKSGGEQGYIEDFQIFIDDAQEIVKLANVENPAKPIFMLGHSMGGFITAGYGAKYPNQIQGQILSGAATIDLPVFAEIKRQDIFDSRPRLKAPNALSNLICRDTDIVKDYDNDSLVLKETNIKLLGEVFVKGPAWLAENIKAYTYPCLILHGQDDQIVTSEASKWLYESISSEDKDIKIYDKCYHEILNEKQEKDIVLEDINRWIEKRI